MFEEYLRNERGFSMTELLVAATIGIIVLAATIYIFTSQEKLLKQEDTATDIRAKGRHAINVLAKEVRMAGYGLPSGQGVTAPDPLVNGPTISFRSNMDNIRTSTPPGSSGTQAAGAGDTTITVISGSLFSDNDKIVIHDPSYEKSELNTVNGTPTSTSIPLNTGLINTYTYGMNASLVTVHKYNDVTIALSGTEITKTVDGSTTPLISDIVATTGLNFDFYGETDPGSLKRVGITVNLQDPQDADAQIEFKTDVALRN